MDHVVLSSVWSYWFFRVASERDTRWGKEKKSWIKNCTKTLCSFRQNKIQFYSVQRRSQWCGSSNIRRVLTCFVFHLPFFWIVSLLWNSVQHHSKKNQIHEALTPGRQKWSLQFSNPSLTVILKRLNVRSDMWRHCTFQSSHFMEGNDSPYILGQIRVCRCQSRAPLGCQKLWGEQLLPARVQLDFGAGAAAGCGAAEKALHPPGARPVPYNCYLSPFLPLHLLTVRPCWPCFGLRWFYMLEPVKGCDKVSEFTG